VGGGKGEHLSKPAELSPESLLWAIVSVFIVGLGAIIALTALMKAGDGIDPIILAVVMLSFLLMLVVEGVFIRLLLKRQRGVRKMADAEPSEEQAIKELGGAQARLLQEPAPSVTEHTTRAFEPIYSERKTK
jgi:hypothetical protein